MAAREFKFSKGAFDALLSRHAADVRGAGPAAWRLRAAGPGAADPGTDHYYCLASAAGHPANRCRTATWWPGPADTGSRPDPGGCRADAGRRWAGADRAGRQRQQGHGYIRV